MIDFWTERRLLIDEQVSIIVHTIPHVAATWDDWDIRRLATRMVDTAIARGARGC